MRRENFRITIETVNIKYDKNADVLYISFYKEPREGVGFTEDNGCLVRVDREAKKVIGLTLLDFKERYL